MLNLYSKYYNLEITVKCSTVIDDVLYVVTTEGEVAESVKLTLIDMTRLIEMASYTINYKPNDNISAYKFFGDKLYCHPLHADEYTGDISVFDINTLEESHSMIEDLRSIIELKGKLCYIKYVYDDNNEDEDNRYYLCDMDTDDRILTIIDNDNTSYFENGVLYLSFNVNFINGIYTSDSYLIFMTHYSTLVYFDVNSKLLFEWDIMRNKELNTNIGKNSRIDPVVRHLKYPVNTGSDYHDIGNNKIFEKHTIRDYKEYKNQITNLNIANSFKYGEHNYYIHTTKNDRVININIDIKPIVNNVPVPAKYPQYITIGSKSYNVQVPLSFIYGRSQYIQDMINISEGTVSEFINDNHKNMRLYLYYLEGKDLNVDKLDKIYKIASLMLDTNMEYLTYVILNHVKNFDLSIDDAWIFLELLYNDNIHKKFETLMYIIFKKYDREDFISKITNINDMNNIIILDLIRTRVM